MTFESPWPPPPSYTQPSHNSAFASSQEELTALQQWAESKRYVQPGKDGTLPAMDKGGYGLQSLVWGGPMETGIGTTLTSEDPAQRQAALKEVDAAKRKEEETKMKRKPSLREKLKQLVKGNKSKEEPTIR